MTHELHVQEGMELKMEGADFTLKKVHPGEEGKFAARIKVPRNNPLWQELGSYFELYEGDTFVAGPFTYCVKKISPANANENGRMVLGKYLKL